jgi:competence/damage-inducible protein CinA C-terminal domain
VIAELICVGTELLMGQILNTNAHFIAGELAPSGVDMYHQTVVGDNPARLAEAIRTALSRADVVLLSGGLGPTDDDLTKETAAAVLGKELVLFADEWQKIVDYFALKGRAVAPNNKKQAMFPRDAIILPNPNGTAPGCIMEADGKALILMPGPPRELRPMFLNHVLPWLLGRAGHRLYSREVRIFGMGESDVTYRLDSLIKSQTNPTVAPYAKTGEVTLRVTARCRDDAEGEALVAPMLETIQRTLGDVVYDTNGRTLAEVCHHMLIEKGKTLAVAESCTGGRLADAFITYPGSSAYFIEGDVTYSNDAKMRRLGVSAETLDTVGAVSEECAREMAEGCRKAANADFALSTTGYAGPDPGEPDKPRGTVFIALASADGTVIKRLNLFGDRDRVRHTAVLHALDLLRRKLCTK